MEVATLLYSSCSTEFGHAEAILVTWTSFMSEESLMDKSFKLVCTFCCDHFCRMCCNLLFLLVIASWMHSLATKRRQRDERGIAMLVF